MLQRSLCMTLVLATTQLLARNFCSAAELQLDDRTRIVFASKVDAEKLLTTRDEFIQRLSDFDRSARRKTDQSVDEQAFLKFVGQQALDWTPGEVDTVTEAFEGVKSKLASLSLNWPAEIQLIKTTGLEEGNAAYTRGRAIILPRDKVTGAARSLQGLLVHELFHVLSRHDSQLRQRLYQLIGFEPCGELEFPADMRGRKITNPDAPINNHCIRIQHKGSDQWAVPVLYSKRDTYDTTRGGEFFHYMTFELMLIDRAAPAGASKAQRQEGKPVLLDPKTTTGFLEQLGRNTGYIIHPDEVLADNFVHIVTGKQDVPSPKLLEQISQAMHTK